ncbi:MAG: Glycine cleavage system protein [Solimicrobium sp.]|nr:Glycine cleavage system protein [Solimicrobium sp.]
MNNLKFTSEHEWLRLEADNAVTVGITDYAQSHLGDLVYIQLPDVNVAYKAGDEVAVIESVKTAGGIAMPFDGKVVEVNTTLNDQPDIVNQDPLGAGWFFKMTLADSGKLNSLMDEAAYKEFVAKLG